MAPLQQRVEAWVARRLLRLPPALRRALSGGGPVERDGRTLDPEIQLIVRLRRLQGRQHAFRESSPERARAAMRRDTVGLSSGKPDMHEVRDLAVDGAEGPLRARHYVPRASAEPLPLMVFYHGGGFVVGDLDSHDDPCRILASRADVHILSVDYRLAPEHPFPAAVLDARAALGWAQAHAHDLGADPSRVGVGGDSAGGNLAAVVSSAAAPDAPPAFQLLIYPATDRRHPHPSIERFGAGFVLTAADMAFADECYFGARDDVRPDPRLSPLARADLGGLCPAVVVTAGFDPLRDEGNAYAEALRAAGNHVDHAELEGFVHGFLHMTTVSASARSATEEIGRRLHALAHRSDAPDGG